MPPSPAGEPAYTSKTSLITYDNLGNEVKLDIYAYKTAANTWDIFAYNNADSTAGGYPYSSAALDTDTFMFDPSATGLGKLDPASPTRADVQYSRRRPGSRSIFDHDAGRVRISNSRRRSTAMRRARSITSKSIPTARCIPCSRMAHQVATYRIPLATAVSPDNLTPGGRQCVFAQHGLG